MKFEDMKLMHGYALQLQTSNSEGQVERLSCHLIGCLPGHSILLSVPKVAGKLASFNDGQKIAIRLTVDNGVAIFRSTVTFQTMEPYPILHIACPENINYKVIRNATRVATDLPVELINLTVISDKLITGQITDMSVTGAKIEATATLGGLGHKLSLMMNLSVGGVIRSLEMDATIKSCLDLGEKSIDLRGVTAFGVEFSLPNNDDLLLLYAYVFSEIANEATV